MAVPARIAAPNALLGPNALRAVLLARPEKVSQSPAPTGSAAASPVGASQPRPVRERPRSASMPKRYFNPSPLQEVGQASPGRPPDENKVKLGKTLRILQERLPTLLQSPLPQDILAPNISLHLFPSTHPHLPTVSGRVAYTAALWTSPIAWNRLPVVGDVKLEILSERMVKEPLPFAPRRAGAIPDQLVVRWCSKGTVKTSDEGIAGGADVESRASTGPGTAESTQFTGLFIFQFDDEGRILAHTIEHVQEGGNWEKGVGATVVGLTDWLLGGMKGRTGEEGGPLPACEGMKMKTGSGAYLCSVKR